MNECHIHNKPFVDHQAKERELMNRALQLVGPTDPMYNLAPLLQLLRAADALGFDVVRRDDGLCQMQRRADPAS